MRPTSLGIGLTLAAAVLALAAPAQAGDEKRPVFAPSKSAPNSAGYWTPERMRNARPLPAPPLPKAAGRASAVPRGQRVTVAPTGARTTEKTVALQDVTSPQRWTGGGGVAANAGKLFMHFSHGDFVCSASVVSADNRDAVATAAHCIFDRSRGQWAQQVTFVPGYNAGSAPHGQFTMRTMVMSTGWSDPSTPTPENYDFAVVVTNPLNGRHIQEVVGSQGIGFNHARHPYSYLFGYPGDRDNGQIMQYCSGPTFDDPAGRVDHEAIRCGMTGGSSGGPLLERFDPATGFGYVIGVNSLVWSDINFGTYLGDDALAVYRAAGSA
ncbi:MAG TPA: trypsin-like serine protease [Thermomonospora sp.]|nr:trypsin-like serine protease [Thermomonospora sp.]